MAKLTYTSAGVDIAAGAELVERIGPLAAQTARPGVASGIGGFGALFDVGAAGYKDPVLVAATDGVGTKLALAVEAGRLEGVGIDLVAMCVNDLICQGAEPLFFLDYFATGVLDVEAAATVIAGIAEGCRLAGAALIGGETAEMPGMYRAGEFDLAGFAVGAMERGAGLPRAAAAGDVLLGLGSDGVHSNGFSLVRAVLRAESLAADDASPFGTGTVGAALLRPTRIYVPAARAVMSLPGVRGIAHITGGGLPENVPRMLGSCGAEIDLAAWSLPPVFAWLIEAGGLDRAEALKTFNCGIGLVLAVAPEAQDAVGAALTAAGETVIRIGKVTDTPGVAFQGDWAR
ncbi:MAG: phosphoribosylformylglycinamidine cyclo-ligase [Pseudomonadota bacterium]